MNTAEQIFLNEIAGDLAQKELTIGEVKTLLSELSYRPSMTELAGSWVWVTFAGIPDRPSIERLKAIGFWWSPKHKQWYRQLNGEHSNRKASNWSKEKINIIYQAQEVKLARDE